MGVILEILAWIVFEFIGVVLGVTVRFVIFKIFKPSLQFDEFLNSESGSNDFYNFLVGIPIFIGLIFGLLYLFN
ncbi:hypothetical protein HX001_07760 [Empedobacter brevis]|uniref:Uncharacterized protein n=1 Tax=Empedobacter brevis TaxID=247 RepID=A0AAJ1QE19_9FLAO|nr:hypothetical protein [Empedobacter brevis]MDM1072383.1 hypothetical protein [Empedobacter brevis]QHC84081.1 hypothetical protein AS589_04405 [Empedobacter brevis]